MVGAAILALVLTPQAVDLSQVPGLDRPISLHLKNQLLLPTLRSVLDPTGVKYGFNPGLSNFKTTILVKDIKASALLERVASTFDLKWNWDGKTLHLSPDWGARDNFFVAETEVMKNRARAMVYALAAETKRPFQPIENKEPSRPPENETPVEWAKRRVHEPAFYVLGVCERETKRLSSVCIQGVFESYRIAPKEAPHNAGSIDQNSAALEGYHAALWYRIWTGDLQVASLVGDKPNNEFNRAPYLYARPPKELVSHSFAERLAHWETPVASIDAQLLKKELEARGEVSDPGYFEQRLSLAEKLEELHDRGKLQIVGDSYRVPTLAVRSSAEKVGDYLKDLVEVEKIFLRWENGVLLVRHPAYWRLEKTEPPESVLLQAESIARTRPLNFTEYCRLARSLIAQRDSMIAERFLSKERVLVRFDPTPLIDSAPALYQYDCLDDREREALWAGTPLYTGVKITPPESRYRKVPGKTYGRGQILGPYGTGAAPFYKTQIVGRIADFYFYMPRPAINPGDTLDSYWLDPPHNVREVHPGAEFNLFWAGSGSADNRTIVMNFGDCPMDYFRYVINLP
jgi:hypothetical protein